MALEPTTPMSASSSSLIRLVLFRTARVLILAGCLAGGALSAALTPRLDRVAIVRFSDAGNGQLRMQSGTLDLDGGVTIRQSTLIDRPANAPGAILDRNLIRVDAWRAYHSLGNDALGNFRLLEGAVSVLVGDTSYSFIGLSEEVQSATGQLINISTRARVATGNDSVIAGFVVANRDQLVLVRVVGPTLQAYGVTDAMPDPQLSVKRGNQTIHVNDTWYTHATSNSVRLAASRVGAFPLAEGSKDAARLLRLQPGVYTVVAEGSFFNRTGGTVLVEVYGVPDASDYELITTGADS